MISFFQTILIGLISGILLATPPGVINLTILHCLSLGKARKALWVGAGSAALDVLYCLLAMYSASAVYVTLSGFIEGHRTFMKALEGVFILGLIGFALYKLFLPPERHPPIKEVEPPVGARKLHPFFLGCALALTHIVVPTFLPGYAYLAALLINAQAIPNSNFHFVLMSVAFGIGNFVWVVCLVGYFRDADPSQEKERFRRIDVVIGTLFLIIGLIGLIRILDY